MINEQVKKILQPVYEMLDNTLGIDMRYVRINLMDLPEKNLGRFTPDDSCVDIYINRMYFDVVTDELAGIEAYRRLVALLQTTVLHELTHVSQFTYNNSISIKGTDIEKLDAIQNGRVPYVEMSTEIDSRMMEALFAIRHHKDYAKDYVDSIFNGVSRDSHTLKNAIETLQIHHPELLHELVSIK